MKEVIFKLYGFTVKTDTVYEVTSKVDSSAPDGFKEYKTSKVLHPDVKDGYPGAVFDTNLNIWDTGFYENSKALIKAIPSEDERKKFVKQVQDSIVKPLSKLKGKDYLSQFQDNNAFWDNFRINLYKGKIFSTNKPEEVLQLYLAILHKQITPKPLESNPEFKNSQYCVIDKEDSVDRKMETEMGMMEATGKFMSMLEDKKDDLLLLLDYLKLNVSKGTNNKALASMFNNWLRDKTDGYQNYSVFLKTYKYFLTEEGEREIFFYSKLKELIKKGVVKQRKTEIYFDDEFVGSDLKAATLSVMADKKLQEELLKHIE